MEEERISLVSSTASDRIGRNKEKRDAGAYLFKYLFLTQIVLYLEAGAVPCLLDQLSSAADLTAQQQGALGGVVYLALSAASPFCGYLFKHYNAKIVLGMSLVANNLSILGFALTPMDLPFTTILLICSRALVGFTQAFVSVYAPLWVDEFAPRRKLTGWMSYLQGSVPLGVMLGYLIGVLVNGLASSEHECVMFFCWRWPFLIQFLLLFPLMIGIFFIPTEHLSIHDHERCIRELRSAETADRIPTLVRKSHHPHVILEEETHESQQLNLPQMSAIRASYVQPRIRLDSFNLDDIDTDEDVFETSTLNVYGSVENSPVGSTRSSRIHSMEFDDEFGMDLSFFETLLSLLRIRIYVLVVFGLTSVYFVVTGVQYWGTIYMIKTLHAPRYLVNTLFIIIAGTGPISGVFFGGWLIDRRGGYKGVHNRAKALKICVMLGVVAFLVASVTTFTDNIFIAASLMWLLLFFGGSILPACTGIFISCVPRLLRPFASSLAVMVFNLLGYSLSPYLTGSVMTWVLSGEGYSEADAYRYGFRFSLAWCVWSFLFISGAYLCARSDSKQKFQLDKTLDIERLKHPVGDY